MTLFEYEALTRARTNDPETSKEAARKLKSEKVSRTKQLILYWLGEHPEGLTDWEISEIEGDHGPNFRSRRNELTRDGYLKADGTRVINGRKHTVWKLAHQSTAERPF